MSMHRKNALQIRATSWNNNHVAVAAKWAQRSLKRDFKTAMLVMMMVMTMMMMMMMTMMIVMR